ncbi:SNF2 family N-terminal domain [Rhizoctonia solani]|uniref:SNF2 family N-terminal domain n=1 Tax=Rhizoctonia solani TaxID=456999 RepID=A0A8H7I2Z5_9AGAM|nr:SNF2 family N-terminal domain [Rhizoctonia solani]
MQGDDGPRTITAGSDSKTVKKESSNASSQHQTRISPKAPSVIELSSDSDDEVNPRPSEHISQYAFPDGEVIEIGSSDEEPMPALPIPRQSSSDIITPRPSSTGTMLHRQVVEPLPVEYDRSQMFWTQNRSRPSSPESVGSFAPSSRKRLIQYTNDDGEADESTDDQHGYSSVDTDGPEGHVSKRARYGMFPETGVPYQDEEFEEDYYGPANNYMTQQIAGQARAGTIMPGHFTLHPVGQAPAPVPYPATTLYGSASYHNGYQPVNAFNNDILMPTVIGSNIPMAPGPLNRFNGGFNLNYDDSSPATWLDTNGPNRAVQLQKFFEDAMDDHESAIPVRDATKALGLSNTTERLPGMQVPLMPHQLIGVAWMVKQELGQVAGGILAKTQTIALIAKNRPEKKNPRQATLVVAPAALLDQWKDEILSRTDDGLFKVRIHHGKDKLRSAKEVGKYDIIITTFQTLTNEFPTDEIDMRKKKAADKKKKKSKQRTLDYFIVNDSSDEGASKKKAGYGPLAMTKWYRVVIDEAQNIRNRCGYFLPIDAQELTATLIAHILGQPGLALTNTLADLYGLVRFLHYAPFNDWSEFNEKIVGESSKRDPSLLAGAQALLKKCLLRRTKNSKLEGKPLITLPPKTIDMEMLEFSPDERQVYQAVEARQQQTLNKFIRAGTVMKNYHLILVMLLRLRQSSATHCRMSVSALQGFVLTIARQYASGEFIADSAQVVTSDEDNDDNEPRLSTSSLANSKTNAKALMGDERFNMVTRQFHNTVKDMITAEITGGDLPDDETLECQVCYEPFVGNACVTVSAIGPVSPRMGLIAIKGCLDDLFKLPLQGEAAANEEFGRGRQYANQEVRPCPKCRGELTTSQIFSASIFEPTEKEKDDMKRQIETELGRVNGHKLTHADADEDDDFVPAGKGKSKSKYRIKSEDDDDEVDFGAMGEGEDLVPGAKMIHMLNLLTTWHKEAPEDKIIAYSQWTSMIDLMQILLKKSGFESLRYDGQMKREEREHALSRFKKQGGPKIILISLKCGGVVSILLKPTASFAWTSHGTQPLRTKQLTELTEWVKSNQLRSSASPLKVPLKNGGILKLQAEKQNLSDAALGEGNGTKMSRMNVAQLKMLFGLTH